MILLTLMLQLGCITNEIKKDPGDFPDNQSDDYDNDGLSEFDGDCDDLNQNVLGPSLWYVDSDGDGFGNPLTEVEACQVDLLDLDDIYVAEGTDCDDENPGIHPDMVESCDGLDNDCSGEVDDYQGTNAPLWYYDDDNDGFGDAEVYLHSCNGPVGYVSDKTDCDDSNADAYPNAPEFCDGVDTNCNGIDDDSAIDVRTWYADSDSDGYGDLNSVDYSCTQPVGFVDNSDDCNDLSNAQYPGAPEICNGQDDSCDGQIDEGVLNTYYLDLDGDSFGNALQTVMACTAQPGTVSDSSDCDDTEPLVNPNAAEYCNLRDDDCDGQEDEDSVDATLFYIDTDGDGRGVPSQTLLACPIFDVVSQAPAGYSFYNDDCDDTDANRAPNLPELCTATVDENCDGDTTIGATDVVVSYADSDGDGQGNPLYTVAVCNVPFDYVSNSDDCNDTDPDVLSGMPVAWELCNGKLDRCEDDDGSLTPPEIEIDDDGDGFVECVLDVDPLQWEDPNATRPLGDMGGGDCEDDDPDAYPNAAEKCNGTVDNFSGDGFCLESLPSNEIDNDLDGFVECGYDPQTWDGDVSVVGGGDCNDSSDFTYPGAAVNNPNVCAQDLDNDGDPDCNFDGTIPNHQCEFGVFPSVGMGPDFVWIPSGNDPLNRYSITFDFYMMTTEVTEAIWDAFMGDGSSIDLRAKNWVNWHDAAAFANAVSVFSGKEQCYDCQYSSQENVDLCTEAVLPITECMGYRLPTEWEWEYAARSGTVEAFWTGDGATLGGNHSSDTTIGTETITDGVTNPLLGDYAWYGGNNSASDRSPVGLKLPNGFGLYDMHGNLSEWTGDWYDPGYNYLSTNDSGTPPSDVDPWNSVQALSWECYRTTRGGGHIASPAFVSASVRFISIVYPCVAPPTAFDEYNGFRLVLRAP